MQIRHGFWIALCLSLNVCAQQEKVYLEMAKYTLWPGEMLPFKATIIMGGEPSTLSTNLFVQVFRDNGKLLSESVFPIFKGHGFGQIVITDTAMTAGTCYVVAFTRQQLNHKNMKLFMVPLGIINKSKPYPGSNFEERKSSSNHITNSAINSGIVSGINWTTQYDKENIVSSLQEDSLSSPRKLRLAKNVHGDTSIMADVLLESSSYSKKVAFPLDTSREVETLYLYDDTTLIGRQHLHIKTLEDKVEVDPDTLDISSNGYNSWKARFLDSTVYFYSVSVTNAENNTSSRSNIYQLYDPYTEDMTVPNKLVDNSYITLSGKIVKKGSKEIGVTTGEILVNGIKNNEYIFEKLVKVTNTGKFTIDSLIFFDTASIQLHLVNIDNGSSMDIKLNPPEPSISLMDSAVPGLNKPGGEVIQTKFEAQQNNRQGKDTSPINDIQVVGFTPIQSFRQDTDILYWNPWITKNDFRIQFNNNQTTRKFRIRLSGISREGKLVYYERIIE